VRDMFSDTEKCNSKPFFMSFADCQEEVLESRHVPKPPVQIHYKGDFWRNYLIIDTSELIRCVWLLILCFNETIFIFWTFYVVSQNFSLVYFVLTILPSSLIPITFMYFYWPVYCKNLLSHFKVMS